MPFGVANLAGHAVSKSFFVSTTTTPIKSAMQSRFSPGMNLPDSARQKGSIRHAILNVIYVTEQRTTKNPALSLRQRNKNEEFKNEMVFLSHHFAGIPVECAREILDIDNSEKPAR
jgi:hypothetical protein